MRNPQLVASTRTSGPAEQVLHGLATRWREEARRLREWTPDSRAAALEEAACDLELAIAMGKLASATTPDRGRSRDGWIRATDLYDHGYEDLVSVAPPGTYVLTRSTIVPDSHGKTPGRLSASRWFAYRWDRPHGRRLAEEIDRSGANIGLRARNFPGLNLNTDDPDVTLAVLRVAEEVLGPAPQRMSCACRRLLMYRTDRPIGGRRATVSHKGRSHAVELLGDGQHYVLLGRHHGGARATYTWSRIWRPEDLTRVSEADATRFFEALETQLGEAGFSVYLGTARRSRHSPVATAGSTTQAPFFAESGTSPPSDDESTDVRSEGAGGGSHV